MKQKFFIHIVFTQGTVFHRTNFVTSSTKVWNHIEYKVPTSRMKIATVEVHGNEIPAIPCLIHISSAVTLAFSLKFVIYNIQCAASGTFTGMHQLLDDAGTGSIKSTAYQTLSVGRRAKYFTRIITSLHRVNKTCQITQIGHS
jgi:hypothetical protein